MIVTFLKRLAWALLLLLVQVLILDKVHPWGYGAPLLCPLIVITLPLGTSRTEALLWGLLELMAPRDSEEQLHPSFSEMGRWNHFQFIALLLLLHHVVYFALEGFSYFFLEDIAISMGVSYAASLILIILVEHVRGKEK